MRLYLSGESKNGVGYTPDWLKVFYEENGREMGLTLDIQGEIDYDNKRLDCRSKGDLIPWVLWDYETDDETDLSELSEEELDEMFPVGKLAAIISGSKSYEIGLYPTDDKFELAETDVLSDCEGSLEMYDDENEYRIDFKFETELNVY